MLDEDRSWCGVPLSDIHGSHSPWSTAEFPIINPAYNHTVLFHVSDSGFQFEDRPPKPQPGIDKWDQDCVRMPCSSHSLYPVSEGGKTSLRKRWDIIQNALQKQINNSHELAEAILSYNTKFKSSWKFTALHMLFDQYLEEEESQYFFSVTLPDIAKLALALPKLIQSPIPLLRQHKNRSISLSQQQISSLLANAFFCTFPRRNTTKRTSEYASYPFINFNTLYESRNSDSILEKLKCICHYFRRVCTKVPVGVMTFMRHTVPPKDCPKWAASEKLIGGTPLHVNSQGTIEGDGRGLIQVDFANKYLGGGVLNRGCVQEEIRFVICPELMVSMLFTESLRPTEALLMIGCEQYSSYIGYGHTFQWAGNYEDGTPHDMSGRRKCAVLAIDALPFARPNDQYRPELITRELNKAWVGMSVFTPKNDSRLAYPGVATGNWGCGAFGGSANLKVLLQLMACAEARRPIAYYTFDDVQLRNDIINIYNVLSKYNVTVGQLYKIIMKFTHTTVHRSQLHSYIHQLLKDEDTSRNSNSIPEAPSNATEIPTTSNCHSPDIFSLDEDLLMSAIDDIANIESEVAVRENVHETNDIDKSDLGQDTLKSSDNNARNTKRTSVLFQQMTTFDEESGNLNLQSNNRTPAKNLHSLMSKNDESQVESVEIKSACNNQKQHNESSSLVIEKSVKKGIGKKITDYFNKK